MNVIMGFDQKLKINLGGHPHKVHIKSNDENKPVLLFLHGGPGVVNRHSIFTQHADLLDTFTIACYDQRGTGGSYFGVSDDTLTVSQLTQDAAELVSQLCERFNKDKIFVIGGSWGSELGTHLVYAYPEHIAALVGFGQVVDGTLNEKISFEFALNAAQKANDEKSVAVLNEVGPPEKGVYKGGFAGLMKQRKVMMKYGGYSQSTKKQSMLDAFVKPMLLSGEYSARDLYGVIRGYKRSLKVMWPQVGGSVLLEECPELKVPVFIFDGVYDNNTPAALVGDYFNKLQASKKELHWFENSGHNPMSDEPEKFKRLLREKFTEIANTEKVKGLKI